MSQLAQRLIMAAGGGKKTSTYIEDVFSTYLYKGNQTSRTIDNGIKLSNANQGNSVYFNGVADNKIKIAASADFAMGSGDFTWEAWVYHNSSSNQYRRIICTGVSWNSDPSCGLMWDHGSHNNKYNFYSWNINTSGPFLNSAEHATFDGDGLWHHVAVTRSGNTYTIWVDGVSEGTATHSGSFEAAATPTASIGACFDTTNVEECWAGNINDVRITKGQALYTTNFTPSTESLTTTSQGATGSNVKLLCCNGTTASSATVTPNSLTVLNDVKSQSFGRFTATDAKGGMVWTKARTGSSYTEPALEDTLRGVGREVWSNSNAVETYHAARINSFNSSGYSMGTSQRYNQTGLDYVSWTFAKQEGFFDVVTWTGDNDANRQIPHGLGSIPGCIMVKCRNQDQMWSVYHRGVHQSINPEQYHMILNNSNDQDTTSDWNDTAPTSTHFTVSNGQRVNYVGYTYVAYVFAGGPSDAAGSARSIDFDGSGDYLSLAATTDLNLTGDFTIEFWVFPRSQATSRQTIMQTGSWGSQYAVCQISNQTQSGLESKAQLWDYDMNSSYAIAYSKSDVPEGEWTHVAFTRESGKIRVFLNGNLDQTFTGLNDSIEFGHTTALIGNHSSSWYLNAELSNFRIVNGTAVYTSSFIPPTQGLTNITNTKLLCCNKNTPTGSTVTPGTITSHGDPQSIADTPFDDLAAFTFGEGGDQNIIKCGHYKTDAAEHATPYCGWEPQWILAKRIDANAGGNWMMFDSMRGLANAQDVLDESGVTGKSLLANADSQETNSRVIGLSPQGFAQDAYGANRQYLYIAIRRPDGYVGKPLTSIEAFDIKLMETNGTEPFYKTQNTVDMGLGKRYDTGSGQTDWFLGSRSLTLYYQDTSGNNSQMTNSYQELDYQQGWNSYTGSWGDNIGFAWKRHAGFDVVTYKGNDVNNRQIPHNLSKIPEMIWTKNRGANEDWAVYHKDLQTNNFLRLNLQNNEGYNNAVYEGNPAVAPTKTHWQIGDNDMVNNNNANYVSYLFATTDVSKVGYYNGSGGVGNPQSMGFQPRLVLIKNITDNGTNWMLINSVHGFSKYLLLNTKDPFVTGTYITPSATGFSFTGGPGVSNELNKKYIYYAHA